MALFGPTVKVRRPVADIVSGLATMVTDLEESNLQAAVEQNSAEDAIIALQAERKLLINEQQQAGAITSNLKSLLGLDLDANSEPDDLDKAIATFGQMSADTETVIDINDE